MQLEVDCQAYFQMQPIFIVLIVKKVTILQYQNISPKLNTKGLYMVLICKHCEGEVTIIRRSFIVQDVVWVDCHCDGGTNYHVPVHIPDEQIERYLIATVQAHIAMSIVCQS